MRINPEIKLPIDTPELMVEMFKRELEITESVELKKVLNNLIMKWSGWHATTFRFLHTDGYVGMKVSNWNELYEEVVLI